MCVYNKGRSVCVFLNIIYLECGKFQFVASLQFLDTAFMKFHHLPLQ